MSTIYNILKYFLPLTGIFLISCSKRDGNPLSNTQTGTLWTFYSFKNVPLTCSFVNQIAFWNNEKWFATSNNLVKYDDTNWTVYKNPDTVQQDHEMNTIAIDKDGNKWLGIGSNVVVFNNSEWNFQNPSDFRLTTYEFPILSIVIDRQKNIWVGTYGGGLSKYNGNTWNLYTSANSKLVSNYIVALAVNKENELIIGTASSGIYKLHDSLFTDLHAPTGSYTNSIAVDSNDVLWIGYELIGLYCFDGSHWTIYDKASSSLPSDMVYSIAVDQKNAVWIGTGNGIAKFSNGQWKTFDNLIFDKEFVFDVRSVSIDSYNNKWFCLGMYTYGVAKYTGD